MQSAGMNIRAVWLHPHLACIGRGGAFGYSRIKCGANRQRAGRYRITRPLAERGQRSGKPPTPQAPKGKVEN